MQRRQPAGDIHDEHGALAERATVRCRAVETPVGALNHTGVRVGAVIASKVMQRGEGARAVEREDRTQSEVTTVHGGSVDETIAGLESAGRPASSRQ